MVALSPNVKGAPATCSHEDGNTKDIVAYGRLESTGRPLAGLEIQGAYGSRIPLFSLLTQIRIMWLSPLTEVRCMSQYPETSRIFPANYCVELHPIGRYYVFLLVKQAEGCHDRLWSICRR